MEPKDVLPCTQEPAFGPGILVLVWHLVSRTKVGAQIQGFWELGTEENIWT
jgi:hypothetical protein